jgi:hypothetical protein
MIDIMGAMIAWYLNRAPKWRLEKLVLEANDELVNRGFNGMYLWTRRDGTVRTKPKGGFVLKYRPRDPYKGMDAWFESREDAINELKYLALHRHGKRVDDVKVGMRIDLTHPGDFTRSEIIVTAGGNDEVS